MDGYEVGAEDILADGIEYREYPRGETELRVLLFRPHQILRAVQAMLYGTPFRLSGDRYMVEEVNVIDSDGAEVSLIDVEA